MRPEDLPIQVTLEWPAGVIQRGSATQPNIQEFAKDGKRYVTATVELDPPFNHLAHAKAALDRLDKESAMSEYTAEDFANAMFARHADGGKAARFTGDKRPWRASTADTAPWLSGEEMARDGWVPVPQIDAEPHPDQIELLTKRLAAAGDQIERQRLVLEDLREENYRLERILQAPLSLKDLEVAWENAEVPTDDTPIREGDVVIVRRHAGGFTVEPADRILSGQTHGRERILSRAPRPEPWADLADVLRAHTGEPDPDETARMLHERGVRVTGGDDDE